MSRGQRGEEKERETERQRQRDRHQSVAFYMLPTRDQTCNLGMCPDQELNLRTFVYGTMLRPTEPPDQGSVFLSKANFMTKRKSGMVE